MTQKTYEHSLDPMIIESANAEWQNITGVISGVFEHADFDKNTYAAQDIAERIYILVDNGQLDVEGNMRRWREGRIKLPAPRAAKSVSE